MKYIAEEAPIYEFKTFRLDGTERRLSDGEQAIQLTPKAFDVLLFLVERAGHLVSKEALMSAIWPDSYVEEVNLSRSIHTIRKALGENEDGNKFIENIPKKGYRFVAEVKTLPSVQLTETVASSPALLHVQVSHDRNGWAVRKEVLIGLVALVLVSAGLAYRYGSTSSADADTRTSPRTNNGEAYVFFQQGRVHLDRKRKEEFPQAVTYFEKAIELDPSYSDAYAGKADALIWMFWASHSHDEISKARIAATKAVELDALNPYAHSVMCRIQVTYDWDFPGAEASCRKAVSLDPLNFEAQLELAILLSQTGNDADALRHIDIAIGQSPTSFLKRTKGMILYHARRYDEAIEQLLQIEETDPAFGRGTKWLVRSYAMKGDHAKALEWYVRMLERQNVSPDVISKLRTDFALNGWKSVLEDMVAAADGGGSDRKVTAPIEIAPAYAQLGDFERAFEHLEKGLKRRDPFMLYMNREPWFDPIRHDPRFVSILTRIGLNQYSPGPIR